MNNLTAEHLMPFSVDLSSEVLGNTFANPIVLGSGSLDERVEQVDAFLATHVGAIVPRTTRFEYAPGRDIHPSPHLDIQQRKGNMRNAEWTGYPIEYWRPHLERLSESGRIIMSVSGRDIAGCIEVCKELDSYGFPFFEINISCAHSNDAYGFITRNSEHIQSLIRGIKEIGVKTPLALKLGHSDFIVPLAIAAQEAGVDAIVAINTVGPVLDFDITTGKPEPTLGIAGSKGGLSGSAIFNTALTDVADLSRHLNIPVIACGGVSTAEHAIKMIMAGASLVEVYTAAHMRGDRAPQYLNNLIQNVGGWLKSHGYDKLSALRGMALPLLETGNQMKPIIPQLVENLCIGCQKCVVVCNVPGAIAMVQSDVTPINESGLIPEISEACIGCGACVTICPTDALPITWQAEG